MSKRNKSVRLSRSPLERWAKKGRADTYPQSGRDGDEPAVVESGRVDRLDEAGVGRHAASVYDQVG